MTINEKDKYALEGKFGYDVNLGKESGKQIVEINTKGLDFELDKVNEFIGADLEVFGVYTNNAIVDDGNSNNNHRFIDENSRCAWVYLR